MAHLDPVQNENINELLLGILSLADLEECRAFFSDLCTVQELISFAQRFQVAKRLLAGDTYEAIRSQVPVSSATITRINTALQYGHGGYRTVLSRQAEDHVQESDPLR